MFLAKKIFAQGGGKCAQEMQEIIDGWILKYENVRPHEGLDFLTPSQFEDMFYSSEHSSLSYML